MKQAEQIRFSLMQARDYYDSSRAVSAVTKPVLLYYCLMNLATAEILFKQTGDSSLDKARAQHRHHGLSFSMDGAVKAESSMAGASAKLSAQPATRNKGERFGTFELWRRTARELPTIGTQQLIDGERNVISFEALAFGADNPSEIPLSNISLLDCLQHMPALHQFCWLHEIHSQMVRATIRRSHNNQSMSGSFTMAIHPGHKEVYENVIDQIAFRPDCLERVQFIDQGDCGNVIYNYDREYPLMFKLPSSCNIYQDQCFLYTKRAITNEFGYHYISLYMCGNYARYYPDFWIHDIERSSNLSMAIDAVMHSAEERVPLLALSELERTYFVLEG